MRNRSNTTVSIVAAAVVLVVVIGVIAGVTIGIAHTETQYKVITGNFEFPVGNCYMVRNTQKRNIKSSLGISNSQLGIATTF